MLSDQVNMVAELNGPFCTEVSPFDIQLHMRCHTGVYEGTSYFAVVIFLFPFCIRSLI